MLRLSCLACAALMAACAATREPQSTAQPREEKEFRTGSRIPVRDPVSSSPTTPATPSSVHAAPGRPPTL